MKEQYFYCCSIFDSHSRVSYPKMSVKQPLVCCCTVLFPLSINAISEDLYRFNVIWCIEFYFPVAGLSTKQKHQNMGEVILQIL